MAETAKSGDPGRTPGSAEGDLETVEEDLEEKGLDDDQNQGRQQADNQEQTNN